MNLKFAQCSVLTRVGRNGSCLHEYNIYVVNDRSQRLNENDSRFGRLFRREHAPVARSYFHTSSWPSRRAVEKTTF